MVALSQKDDVLLGCVDPEAEQRMKAVVDHAYRTGTPSAASSKWSRTMLPVGLGSHITWDSRLDGRLAQAIVSMQAVKGVEIGYAEEGSAAFGSQVQDTIHYNREEKHFSPRGKSRRRPGRRHDERRRTCWSADF